MNKNLTALLALAAGMAIVLTWPRTKKYVNPLLNGAREGVGSAYGWLAGFGTAQQKRLGDLGSKAGTRKKKKRVRMAAKPKRSGAKAVKALA